MTQPEESSELETALVAVYRGPLDEFVSRRDALAKQLRAAKRRDDADRVKALRKPSRTAWVLDNVVHEDPLVLEQLASAISAVQAVRSGADLRVALDNVRTAIRDVAAAGARVSTGVGQPIDASTLVTAVHAVIGETSAFSDLRAGRLVDVPDGGGLDILSAITINIPSPPPVAASPQPTLAPAAASPNAEDTGTHGRRAERANHQKSTIGCDVEEDVHQVVRCRVEQSLRFADRECPSRGDRSRYHVSRLVDETAGARHGNAVLRAVNELVVSARVLTDARPPAVALKPTERSREIIAGRAVQVWPCAVHDRSPRRRRPRHQSARAQRPTRDRC